AVAGPVEGADPGGPVRRAALLEERLALDAVGQAPQRDAAVRDVGQHHRRDPGVVVDHLGLGEPDRRVEDLVEVRELERAPLDLDELLPPLGGHPQALLRVRFFVGAASASSAALPFASAAAGWRLRASFASLTLASRAAMRSPTLSSVSAAGGATTSVLPAAFCSMSSSTRAR